MPGMEPSAALLAGLGAGMLIAIQVGPVSLLLIETAIAGGPRVGLAAGLGVATVDLTFAAIAGAAGGATGAALSSHSSEIHVMAAVVLAAIAVTGLAALLRAGGAPPEARLAVRGGPPAAAYRRFVAITLVNPLTIASFAAVATALSLDGTGAAVAFAAGVGFASSGWHIVLSGAAGHAGRLLTPRARRALSIAGRIGVLALALHLALTA
jgi:threonine/homoserine/homoserine lactone efflux protein